MSLMSTLIKRPNSLKPSGVLVKSISLREQPGQAGDGWNPIMDCMRVLLRIRAAQQVLSAGCNCTGFVCGVRSTDAPNAVG